MDDLRLAILDRKQYMIVALDDKPEKTPVIVVPHLELSHIECRLREHHLDGVTFYTMQVRISQSIFDRVAKCLPDGVEADDDVVDTVTHVSGIDEANGKIYRPTRFSEKPKTQAGGDAEYSPAKWSFGVYLTHNDMVTDLVSRKPAPWDVNVFVIAHEMGFKDRSPPRALGVVELDVDAKQ